MALPLPESRRLTFGVFTADPSLGRLLKEGIPVKLAPQPFKVLLLLIERRGGMVGREEIREHLWGNSTFVDFERGINFSINQIRAVLCDDVERPRYIETWPKLGYRFIAEVIEQNGHPDGAAVGGASSLSPPLDSIESVQVGLPSRSTASSPVEVPHASSPERHRLTGTKRWILSASLLCVLVLAGVSIGVKLRSSPASPRVIDSIQITKDGLRKSAATYILVSDGARLYFQTGSWDDTERNMSLAQVSVQGGETARVTVSLRNPVAFDFSQSHSEILLGAGEFDFPGEERPLWALPLPAGPPHRLGDVIASDACWGPDGRTVAFTNGREVFVAEANGSRARKLATADGFVFAFWIRFSPDGKRLRFSVFKPGATDAAGNDIEIMEVNVDGTGLHRLPIHGACCGNWSPDGNYYFYKNGRDIWARPERQTFPGKTEVGAPVQLTAGPLEFDGPTPSTDGRHLFVVGKQLRVELVHYDPRSRQFTPFLGGISAGELEVSRDGQWVTYTTFPDGNLWRSKLDGSERLQLTFPPMNAHEPRWSPDGKQILFADVPHKLFIVSADGGAPRQLMSADRPDLIGAGAWLPDGGSIIFGRKGCTTDKSCFAIYHLDLKTEQVSKIPGSEGLAAARLSHDGHYLVALPFGRDRRVMLYDVRTNRWSQLAQAYGSIAWSHDDRSVYLRTQHEAKPPELIRISVPDGRVQRVIDLKGVTLGGFWPDWVSLLPDDSPLFMWERSTEEIYRLDLQYR